MIYFLIVLNILPIYINHPCFVKVVWSNEGPVPAVGVEPCCLSHLKSAFGSLFHPHVSNVKSQFNGFFSTSAYAGSYKHGSSPSFITLVLILSIAIII